MKSHRSVFSTSIRHLKVFESVARLQGMNRACAEFGLSQPAVTQAIANLERELGLELLERRSNGCYANEYGVLFLRRVQRMFALIEEALRNLKVRRGRTTISSMASALTRPQVRALLAVTEYGSFTKAALGLSMPISVVQRPARELEALLQTQLYITTEQGVVATPAAAEFARKLGVALNEIECGVQEIEAVQSNSGGNIFIGAMPLAGSDVLKSVIDDVVHEYPNANIKVMSGNAEDMLRGLQRGDVDVVIGLLRQPTPNGLVSKKLAETPYVVVARHGHPLLGKPDVTVDDLSTYEWVIGTPGANRRTCFEKLFHGRRRPKACIATCSLPTMKVLLSQSDRLTLLTSYELCHDDNALAPVPFGPVGRVPYLGLTMRKSWLPTQLQANVLQLIGTKAARSLAQRATMTMSMAATTRIRSIEARRGRSVDGAR